jgi:cation transport regulator ChaB
MYVAKQTPLTIVWSAVKQDYKKKTDYNWYKKLE